MLDYKDVTFSFQDRRRRQRRRRLFLVLLLLLAGGVFLGLHCLKAGAAVAAIEDRLLAGRLEEAEARLRRPPSPFFQRGSFRRLQALDDLLRGRLDQARERLAGLSRGRSASRVRSRRFLDLFLARGDFAALDLYAAHLVPAGGDEELWFHALARAAFLDAEGAEKALAALSPAYRQANAKAVGLLERFTRSLRSGKLDYVFDRRDEPLACFDLGRNASRSLLPGIDLAPFEAEFRKGARRFGLTLDAGLQRSIGRLFQGRFGTLVLLEIPENAVIAAYSKPRSGKPADAAFSQQFAPGSIVKLVSLLAYLRSGAEVFPLQCPGNIVLEGRVLYELERHGTVQDAAQALARSCNVAFARMGRETGEAALADLLRRFLFNGPPMRDDFLSFAAGRFEPTGGSSLGLARLASGLGGVTLTTAHAAVLASTFAQKGVYFPPYLIADIRNLLDIGFHRHQPRPRTLLADDLNFLSVRQAMAAVIEDEKGTGRRLLDLPVRPAVKTGTTANPAGGLDAVIAGFLPADAPRYAFALRLEGGGRADIQGAAFLRELLPLLDLE